MSRLATALLLVGLIPAGGCALCANPGDDEYSAYGGRWQRHDRSAGRVGSVFAPAGEGQPQADPQPTPAVPTPSATERDT